MTQGARNDSGPSPAEGVVRLTAASDTLPPFDATHAWLVVARDQAALVDPGFRDPGEVRTVVDAMAAAGARDLKMVLLTHTHRDHLAGLPAVRERFGDVPVYVHPAEADRVPVSGTVLPLQDGRRLMLAGRTIQAVHTPGHAPGHLSYWLEDVSVALCGDLLTAEGSTWVGLPEGDANAYLASLDRLASLEPAWLGPAHGPPVPDAAAAIRRARDRRREREERIEAELREPLGLDELRRRVYPDASEATVPVVEASLLAHLIRLMGQTRVVHLGDGPEGPYRRRA